MNDKELSDAIVKLRIDDKLTYKEIADKLGVSYDTVRGRLRRRKPDASELAVGENNGNRPYVSWEDTFDAAIALQDIYDTAEYWDDGEIDIRLAEENTILVVTSDWHIGDKTCDLEALRKDIKSWTDVPNLKVIVNGDMIELGTGTQGKQAETEQVISPEQQHLVARDILRDLDDAEKLLAITQGNHEERAGRVLFETMRFVIEQIDVPIAGNKMTLNLHMGDVIYSVFVSHKQPGATSTNPFGAGLKVIKEVSASDLILLGHLHTWNYAEVTVYGQPVYIATGGSYVDQQYAKRHYNPTLERTNHYFVLEKNEKNIKHFHSVEEAVLYRDSL